MSEFNDFIEEFDDFGQRLVSSRHQDFASVARRFLRLLERAPETTKTRVQWLRSRFPISRVQAEVLKERGGMIGSGQMAWPDDLEDSLSGQLNLLEDLAQTPDSAWQFAHRFFISGSNNIDSVLREMTGHLFDPMIRDLRRYIVRNQDTAVMTADIPASDRLVDLNHNSREHKDADDALAGLETALEQANEGDAEENKRVAAEIGAARRLLQATKIRLSTFVSLLRPGLRWAAEKFAGGIVAAAAGKALAKLTEYLPFLIGLLG